MRAVTAFLLVFLVPAALAQPCDPATSDEVCPDTTDWHRYFPLDVGNQWQYVLDYYGPEPDTYFGVGIVGEGEIGGVPYFFLRECDADGEVVSCGEETAVRYDEETRQVVEYREGDEETPYGLHFGVCDFGLPFGELQECGDVGPVSVYGQYGASIDLDGGESAFGTLKAFGSIEGTATYLSGIGLTKQEYEQPVFEFDLAFARVDGVEYGTPAFASCDPADTDPLVACPDTTDWRRYFPLAVGNQWQYREAIDVDEVVYWGWRITGDTEVDGRPYFELERCDEAEDGSVTCTEPMLIRYDEEHARIVRYDEDGDAWWGLPCDLALPFGGIPQTESGFYECDDVPGEGPYYIGAWGAYGASVMVGSEAVSGDTRKVIGTPIFTGTTLYAGVGPIEFEDELHPEATRLVYARVDGVEYGTPAFTFPTSSEPDVTQPVVTGFTAAFPNPARRAMQAQYTLADPQTMTLELIDLLGRRVRETDLGPQPAGAHDLRLDLGGLRPGLYVLRLRGDAGAEATQRVVVVK